MVRGVPSSARRGARPWALGGLGAAAIALAGCAEPGVTRIVSGHEQRGRFISDEAYAYYARGADAEARGDLRNALAAYEEAERADSESGEVWTRIGAARCKAGMDASEAFAKAAALSPDDAGPREEAARCLLKTRGGAAALGAATEAMARDPESDEAALLHAEALLDARRVAEARRELVALTVRRPGSLEAWEALAHAAARSTTTSEATPSNVGLHDRAAERARAIAAQRGLPPPMSEPTLGDAAASSGLVAVDGALRRGDLAEARQAAKHARLPPAELAVRAVALGQVAVAREQGALVAGADPDDVSSRIALAVAAELAGDVGGAAGALASIAPSSRAFPSPLARFVLADMLLRRAGPDAARAYLGPAFEKGRTAGLGRGAGGDAWASDPLARSVEQRLRDRLCACACPCTEVTAGLPGERTPPPPASEPPAPRATLRP